MKTHKNKKVTIKKQIKKQTKKIGKNYKFILFDGTSSAGKSTVCEFYQTKNYECIKLDDYMPKNDFKNYYSTVKNEYDAVFLKREEWKYDIAKSMIDAGLKSKKKILLDHGEQKNLIKYLTEKKMLDKLYTIIVFTNLDNLARNLESRRKEGDSRGLFVFKNFSTRYIATTDSDINKIEKINRKRFVNILLNNFKYEFRNRMELDKFSQIVFSKMNISDDKDHWIKLRDEYKYDYLLKTTNKTKKDIIKELDAFL
jgi:adenylate kinase family enzyme